tara:strand:+ start:349 stop:516 length:168 start_codon:yes stop_codon:yes gene_type:complete
MIPIVIKKILSLNLGLMYNNKINIDKKTEKHPTLLPVIKIMYPYDIINMNEVILS